MTIFTKIFGLVLLTSLCLFYCAKRTGTQTNLENVQHPRITKDIGELIAIARYGCNGDPNRYNITAFDKEDRWVFEFVFKPEFEHLTGGGAAIAVDKNSGNVISAYIGK